MAFLVEIRAEGLLVVSAGGMFLKGLLADGMLLDTAGGRFLLVEVALSSTHVMGLPMSYIPTWFLLLLFL